MSHRKLCCWTCTKSPQILILKMRVEQLNTYRYVCICRWWFQCVLFVVFVPWNLGIIGSNLTGILFKWVELKSPTSYQFCSLVRLGWGKMWHYLTYTLEKSNMKHKNGGVWWWYAFSTAWVNFFGSCTVKTFRMGVLAYHGKRIKSLLLIHTASNFE